MFVMKTRFLLLLAMFMLGCCPNNDSVRSVLAVEALNQAKEYFNATGATMPMEVANEPKAAARALATFAIDSGGLKGKISWGGICLASGCQSFSWTVPLG